MNFIKKNLIKIASVAFLTFLPILTHADKTNSTGVITNPLSGSNTIQDFILKILTGAIKLAIPVIALAVIYSGFLFVKAQGNPEEITKAKEALMYTLIGAAVLLGALSIATLIKDTVLAL